MATYARDLASAIAAISRPYLTVIAVPPFRFAEPAPPPDLSAHPPAGAPPQPPATARTPATPADAPSAAASAGPDASAASASTPAADATGAEHPAPLQKILPDDTRPKVRPEDFLPFFQFPGAGQPRLTAAPAPPVPGTLPPSSATYQQQ